VYLRRRRHRRRCIAALDLDDRQLDPLPARLRLQFDGGADRLLGLVEPTLRRQIRRQRGIAGRMQRIGHDRTLGEFDRLRHLPDSRQ